MKVLFAVFALLAGFGSATAWAASQGPWVFPAVDLSATGRDAYNPQVAVAPDGTAIVVWRRSNGADSIIQAAIRPPGGTFGAPVDLSATGQGAYNPGVAVSSDGTATVVWDRSNGTNNMVQAVTRPPGGSFGAPVDLSVAGQDADDPDIGVASDGTATVVWRRYDGSHFVVQATTRQPGGSFGTPVDLSAADQGAYAPHVAVAPDGATAVVWSRYDGTSDIVQAATRPPNGSFGAPVDLSATGRDADEPQVSLVSGGAATVTWLRSNGTNTVIQAASRPAGGSFGAPADLSAAGRDAYGPQVAVAADGTATVVWIRPNGTNNIAQAVTRPSGGSFGTPVDLSATGGDSYDPHVAVSPDGTATAIWDRFNGTDYIVQAATRPPGGSFGPPVDLSAAGQDAGAPRAVSALDGSMTAVWVRSNGADEIIQSLSTLQPTLLLQVKRAGDGAGTVKSSPAGIDCGDDCAENLPSFTKVTLTATPSPGSVFVGWSGGGCSGTGSCEVTLIDPTQVTAEFKQTKAKLGPLKIKPKAKKLKAGKSRVIKVKVVNVGDGEAQNAKVCVKAPKKLVKVKKKCVKLGSVAAGRTKTATFKVTLTKKAKVGKKVKLTFSATAQGIAKRTGSAILRRKR